MNDFNSAAMGKEGYQTLIGNLSNFRFKKNKRLSINPPSNTMHITNLVK
jgi:hypothetical protein